MLKQLTFDLHQRASATFDNVVGADKQVILTALKHGILSAEFNFLYLWGKKGSGRSYLLRSACQFATEHEKPSIYLPLGDLLKQPHFSPQFFQELETLALIAIDDVDAVVGLPQWEEAIFHLYNRLLLSETCLVIAATEPPRALNLILPDLKSRFTAGIIFQIHDLTDEEKILLLQQMAHIDGWEIPNEVADFLLTRCSREMSDLLDILRKLDEATLVAQRRLTIPFVKEVLEI